MSNKLNCWEYKKCGRQPNGNNAEKLGICPATTETRLNGAHEGRNAGRACWVVAGTLCNGEVQGTYAHKCQSCESCDFYKTVKGQELPRFSLSAELLGKLREKRVSSLLAEVNLT